MSDQADKPAKRGEAAWKEAKEKVAERNAQARKAGKQQRQDYENQKAAERQKAERRQMAQALDIQTRGS
jgi:hypothetical protein